MDKKALGKRINTVRKRLGITADKLAEMVNINATFLRQIEGGTSSPSLPVFLSICNALGTSPNYLAAESLTHNELDCCVELLDLWKKATPEQIELITAMIKVAVEKMGESSEK